MQKKWMNILFLVFISFEAEAGYQILYESMLDKDSVMIGQWKNRNGVFVKGRGWQTINSTSQLMIKLPTPLTRVGILMVDVTNFDPVNQNVDAKQQIINLYSQSNGSKTIFNTNGSWINIRTGTEYSVGKGMAGFKLLVAPCGIDTRDEVRIMENATWDTSLTYEFKITWDTLKAAVFLNGKKCYTLPFCEQVEMFRYVFLGTDNVYLAQPGVIYSNLRILVPDNDTIAEPVFEESKRPQSQILYQNYPNPFNPETQISFDLLQKGHVFLDIFNSNGQRINRLLDATLTSGRHIVTWEADDETGNKVAAGVYIYRLQVGDLTLTRRLLLIK